MNWCCIITISTILNTLHVVSRPKERNCAVGYQFAKHVERCMASLIQSNVPVLCSGSLTIDPVWIRNDVTSSEYVFITGLKVRVASKATIALHLNSTRKELSSWRNTCAKDDEICFDILTWDKANTLCLSFWISYDCLYSLIRQDAYTILRVFLSKHGTDFFTQDFFQWEFSWLNKLNFLRLLILSCECSSAFSRDKWAAYDCDRLCIYCTSLDCLLVRTGSQIMYTFKISTRYLYLFDFTTCCYA